MNIFFNSRINANQSLLNVLFGQQQKAASSQNTGCRGTRDTLTISASGKEKLTKSTSGRTHNTSIDSSIDLKSYIASAKKTNQELIENAGAQINAKTSEYMSTGKAFRAALTEKYSKLAAEAKTHSNPENYIHSKYFDKSSEYYETNLTDTERRIAYNYEMQMCRTGKINGVNYQDSLFRGIEVDGDSVDSDKIQFERALVNSQISNILKQAGVDTSSITKDCTFTVDPYSYEITVDGVDEETKVLMQNALNVGNNGKNLYKHIYYCSTQDGCESSQVTEESKMKFVKGFIQAYDDTEEEYQYEKRANDDVMDMKRLQEIVETNGMNRMLIVDLDGKWIGRPDDEDFKVQYSQKQVSAMARLLKVAQLLTESRKLNPEGRNYLEEFTNIPDIEYKLKQMQADFKDENSYMYDLRQRARNNRANGNRPSYPPTPAEIYASACIYIGRQTRISKTRH